MLIFSHGILMLKDIVCVSDNGKFTNCHESSRATMHTKKIKFLQLHWIAYFSSVKGRNNKQICGVMIIKQLPFTLLSKTNLWVWEITAIFKSNFHLLKCKSNANATLDFQFCIMLNIWISLLGSVYVYKSWWLFQHNYWTLVSFLCL